MCMYHIYMYMDTYIHIYVHIYIYLHIHSIYRIYMYTRIYVYMYTYIHVYMYTYIHIYIYTCIRVYIVFDRSVSCKNYHLASLSPLYTNMSCILILSFPKTDTLPKMEMPDKIFMSSFRSLTIVVQPTPRSMSLMKN